MAASNNCFLAHKYCQVLNLFFGKWQLTQNPPVGISTIHIIKFSITREYASWNFSGETKTKKVANWSITKIANHLIFFKMELS